MTLPKIQGEEMDFINRVDEYLKEAEDIDDAFIKKIAKLTDRNDHTTARLEIAKKVKNSQLIKIYSGIADLAKVYGHTPYELITLRGFADKDLEEYITQKFGEDVTIKINSAL
jgi:hypothetical protein